MQSAFFAALLLPLLLPQLGWLFQRDTFVPSNTLNGVGVGRPAMSEAVLARRTELMIEAQTFAIMRDPEALAGAQRITRLKKLFDQASAVSGLPSRFIAAVAFLESWGKANAESHTGPKGIMQIAQGTARTMGLRMIYAKRYKTVTERKQVKSKSGKMVTQTRKRRVPYQVLVRDERMVPEKAVPAAARYLARLESKFGGRDWALWAYHCGEGCTSRVQAIVERSDGIEKPLTVPRVFFGAHPAHNRELWEAIRDNMERDYSPTYWFRIMRAQQLLELYEDEPAAFKKLFEQYRNRVEPAKRSPHRLTVWLKPSDLVYATVDDLRRAEGRSLVRAPENARFFGFSANGALGSRAAIGAIAYIAWETRRLHDAMNPRGERFQPLEIAALAISCDSEQKSAKEPPSHCSGHVFDISWRTLPQGQREALDFVLNDLGWYGYIGFTRDTDGQSVYHVGPAPSARDFFTRVYEEVAEKARTSN